MTEDHEETFESNAKSSGDGVDDSQHAHPKFPVQKLDSDQSSPMAAKSAMLDTASNNQHLVIVEEDGHVTASPSKLTNV